MRREGSKPASLIDRAGQSVNGDFFGWYRERRSGCRVRPIERVSEEAGRLQLSSIGVNPLGRRDLRAHTPVSNPLSLLGPYEAAVAWSRPAMQQD